MKLHTLPLFGTTDASGDLTVMATIPSSGLLQAVEWKDGDLADGVDAVLSVTSNDSGVDSTLLTLTNANNDAWYYPRAAAHDNTGTGVTYDGTNEIYVPMVISGTLKLVVSSGGDTKSGGAVVYYTC